MFSVHFGIKSSEKTRQFRSEIVQARTQGGGGALGARAPPPPPTREKSSAQKCPKEERKLCPDVSAKKNVHVPLKAHALLANNTQHC